MPRQQRLEVVAKADRVLHKAPEQHLALVGFVHPQKLLVVLLDAAPKGVEGVVVCQNGATIHPRGAGGLECAIHRAHNGALGLLHWRLNPLDLRRLPGRDAGRRRRHWWKGWKRMLARRDTRVGFRGVFSRKWWGFFPYAFLCIFVHFYAFSTFSLHFLRLHFSHAAYKCILMHFNVFR